MQSIFLWIFVDTHLIFRLPSSRALLQSPISPFLLLFPFIHFFFEIYFLDPPPFFYLSHFFLERIFSAPSLSLFLSFELIFIRLPYLRSHLLIYFHLRFPFVNNCLTPPTSLASLPYLVISSFHFPPLHHLSIGMSLLMKSIWICFSRSPLHLSTADDKSCV